MVEVPGKRRVLSFDDGFGNVESCHVDVLSYAKDPLCMAIQLTSVDGPPYAKATVNLGHDIGDGAIMPEGCAFAEASYGVDFGEVFAENGLAEPYSRSGRQVTMRSGFDTYRLYKFDLEKLREYDPGGVARYEKKYGKAFEKERERRFDMESKRQEMLYVLGYCPVGDFDPCFELKDAFSSDGVEGKPERQSQFGE